MSLNRVLKIARADLGYTENPPGSNMTKYGEAYGMNGVPWCVEAPWYWFNQAGERMAFFGGGKTASCSMLLRWYKEQGLTVPVSEVRVGDIVMLNFHGGKDPEHCGLVTGISDIRNLSSGMPLSVWTIEGNTTITGGSEDNGGVVAEKTRYTRNIVGVCRPQYKPEEPEPVSDWENHHAKEHIKWGLDEGLIKGYPDGTVRPDEQVPLWRLMTILHRYSQKQQDDMR